VLLSFLREAGGLCAEVFLLSKGGGEVSAQRPLFSSLRRLGGLF